MTTSSDERCEECGAPATQIVGWDFTPVCDRHGRGISGPRHQAEGWHPDPMQPDVLNELLKDELDACRKEIERLRRLLRNFSALEPLGCGVWRSTAGD